MDRSGSLICIPLPQTFTTHCASRRYQSRSKQCEREGRKVALGSDRSHAPASRAASIAGCSTRRRRKRCGACPRGAAAPPAVVKQLLGTVRRTARDFIKIQSPPIQARQRGSAGRCKRLALHTRHDPGNEPARQAQLHDRNQSMIAIEGRRTMAQIVRLTLLGLLSHPRPHRSAFIRADGCKFLAARPIGSASMRTSTSPPESNWQVRKRTLHNSPLSWHSAPFPDTRDSSARNIRLAIDRRTGLC